MTYWYCKGNINNKKPTQTCSVCGWIIDAFAEDYYWQPGHTSVAYYENEKFKHMQCMRQKK